MCGDLENQCVIWMYSNHERSDPCRNPTQGCLALLYDLYPSTRTQTGMVFVFASIPQELSTPRLDRTTCMRSYRIISREEVSRVAPYTIKQSISTVVPAAP